MFLAGIPVRDALILELARLVDDDTLATRLEDAYGNGVKILALDIAERETIIRALDDPHPASRSSGECCSPNTSAASATGSPDNVVKRTSSCNS